MRIIHALLGCSALTLALPALAQTTLPVFPPDASGTYATNSSNAKVDSNIQLYTVNAKTAPSNSLSVTYDATSRTYRLSSDTFYSFGPTQAIASTANTSDYKVDLGGTSSGNSKTFSIFRNLAGTYSYTRYGLTYSRQHFGVGEDTSTSEAFVFGSPTLALSLPRSGAAYYTGLVDGWADGSRLVNSRGDLLANFATGEIASGLTLSTASGFLGRYDGRGLIKAGQTTFSGSLFGSGNIAYVGGFNGGFYGPTAQEVGLTFALSGSKGAITGAFVGATATQPSSPGSPPAPPTVPVNTTLVAPIRSETFSAIGGEVLSNLAYGTVSASQSAVARTEVPGAIKIAYDAATDSYTVSDSYGSTVFAPPAAAAANGTTTTRTSKASGVSLTLSVAGPTNPRLALTYLSYGLWLTTRGQGVSNAIDRSFVYGVETPAENLPRSGAALYDGEVAGIWAAGNSTYRLAGTSDGSILANFYTGEVRTRMSLVGTEITSNAVATLGHVDGYGSIAAGTAHFNGTMTGSDNVYSGNFQGAFYGPAYQEAGASFALTGENGAGSVNGVLVAKQTPLR